MSLKVKIEKTKEHSDLIKALASKDRVERAKSQEIIARIMEKVIDEQLPLLGASSVVYEDFSFAESDPPEIPIDQYRDSDENEVFVWSQNRAGGLGTSEISGLETIRFTTFTLDSAVSLHDKYARSGQIRVLEKAIGRMLEEVKVKQEVNAWAILLKALAEAQNKSGTQHVIRSSNAGTFNLQDFNDLLVRLARLNDAWNGGTPINGAGTVSDLFISPEIMADIRAFSYNPINSDTTSGVVDAPDAIKSEAFRSGGLSSVFGVQLHQLLEFGKGQKYNSLFAGFSAATQYAEIDGTTNAAVFNASTTELIVAYDASRDSGAIRPVVTDEDTGSTFSVVPDDQFLARQKKSGWYGELEEGRVVLEPKSFSGIIV